MNQPALLFNPSAASTDELEAVFVARQPVLESLVEILRRQSKSKTVQHVLLIGPRGSGKTHLTEMLTRRMASAEPNWRTVRMPEESYSFVGLDELLSSIASRDQGRELAWGAEIPSVDASLATLEARNRSSGQPLLVVIENLPRVLKKVLRGEQEVKRFRSVLMSDPPFTLVATATSYFEDVTRESRPLYDFFRIFTLQDLNGDEVEELVTKRAQWDRDPAVLDHIDALRKRIRAIHHLSGGNPRLVLALFDVIARGVSQDIHRQFLALLDRVTPYYQSRIEDLSTQQAQVLVRLAIAPRAVAASTLAKACNRPTSHITAVLDVLLAERFVQRIVSKNGARTRYAVADRLFRIWLEMRESRGARGRLRFIVEFYRMAYTRRELESAIEHWGGEFSKKIKYSWSAGCEDHALMIDYLSEALSLSGEAQKNRLLGILSDDENDFDNVIDKYREAARETREGHPAIAAALHLALAQRLYFHRLPREAVAEIDAAERLMPGNASTGYLRALALFSAGKFEDAIAAAMAALRSEKAPHPPIVQMHALLIAASHVMLGAPGAKKLLVEALKLDECRHCVALRCEDLVAELPVAAKYREQANTIIGLVTDATGENRWVISALALRATRNEKFSMARDYSRKLTQLDPTSIGAWVQVACAESNLANLDGFVEALSKVAARATGRHRAHLLRDVADALRRCHVIGNEGQALSSVLSKMKLGIEDVSNLYRGLWVSLGPDVTAEWAADVVELFETFTTEPQEPWHSFLEFVRSKQPPEFLDTLHPEIRDAVGVLISEISGEGGHTSFADVEPRAKSALESGARPVGRRLN